MIAVRGLSVDHGGLVAPDGLDLDLPDGTVVAVTGPNGAGKTTLATVLLGLRAPTAGTVTGTAGLSTAAVFQENRLCEHLDAVANVSLVLPGRVAQAQVLAELARAGLDEATARQPVHRLSGGQRRRVALVRALAADADLLVLDEPFTGLDAQVRPIVLALVAERAAGRTTLLLTHDRSEARAVGAVVCLTLPASSRSST